MKSDGSGFRVCFYTQQKCDHRQTCLDLNVSILRTYFCIITDVLVPIITKWWLSLLKWIALTFDFNWPPMRSLCGVLPLLET